MTKTMAKMVGLVGMLCWAGCYNTTNIRNGGLVCGEDDACPDGFICYKDGAIGDGAVGTRGHCWRKGTGPDAGGGIGPDTSPSKSDTANPLACTTTDPNGRFGPFLGCQAILPNAGSTCDPVCQSGCPCDQRCVIETTTYGSFLCEGTAQPVSSFVPIQGTCTGSAGSCAPGSLCVSDDFCPWLCFKTCRVDKDCPANSRCSEIGPVDINLQSVPNVRLCTPPKETCKPTGAASCATPRANFNCVFLAGMTGVGNTDETVCDCKTTHNGSQGAPCAMTPDDCQPGTACVNNICRQICELGGVGSPCPNGGSCTAIYGSKQYGYCNK